MFNFAKRSAALLLLMATAASAHGQAKDAIRFPAQAPMPSPIAVAKLTANMFYVIDSDVPVIVTASPLGIVQVTEEAGPIKVRGLFVDGTGKTETRTFTGKHVFFVEALGTGVCEVLVIPAAAKSANDILRRTLSVQTDLPPPPDPPDPKPPPPKTVFTYLTFVGTTLGTAAVPNDVALRARLKAGGIKVYVESAEQFGARSPGSAKAITDVGVPCIILQDASGNVLNSVRMTTVSAANEFLNTYLP